MQGRLERYFVGIVVLFASLAFMQPQWFVGFKPYISLALGLVMFGIGMTIPTSYITHTLLRPKRVLCLIGLRFLVMPAAAWVIAQICHVPDYAMMGLLVLGTAPGGISANLMAYIARANTALTVLLTLGTTVLAPFLMPVLIYVMLHQRITIDVWTMMMHIGGIILLPITAGLICNRYQIQGMTIVKKLVPAVSMILVVLLICCVIAINQKALLHFPVQTVWAVIGLNVMGYGLGAAVAYGMRWDPASILAVIFDYGMFDGAVAMVVCTVFIGPEAAVPAVLMGILQNISAPLIIYALQHIQHKISR